MCCYYKLHILNTVEHSSCPEFTHGLINAMTEIRTIRCHTQSRVDTASSTAKLCLNIVLYFIVVGSRRLIPPDALQPKAYCTNPGLQSFLLAPPGVSTSDPNSERRNYLGEKWPMNFA